VFTKTKVPVISDDDVIQNFDRNGGAGNDGLSHTNHIGENDPIVIFYNREGLPDGVLFWESTFQHCPSV
jgi:hypothetical protein